MRLIDADMLADEIESMKISVSGRPATFDEAKSDVMQVINEQKTVYAAELLRYQWISVEERLPDKEGKYLVTVYDGITPDVLYFYKRYPYCNRGIRTDRPVWCDCDDYGDFEEESVTHWMPLPAPPEVDKP